MNSILLYNSECFIARAGFRFLNANNSQLIDNNFSTTIRAIF